eukprot:9217290-Pyramimonas_sp.AAC.1
MATAAAERGDQARLYELFRGLRGRPKAGRRDGGQKTVGNLEAERQAWATHFRQVSEGRGAVHE